MPVSPALAARRVLVGVLCRLAAVYNLVVKLTRDSPDQDVAAAFRRVALKAHPDKGGSKEHTQELLEAKSAWDNAKAKGAPGRPRQGAERAKAQPEVGAVDLAEWPEDRGPPGD